MDSRSYDVMKVEDIEELIKVRAPFQFPALMYSNLFRHRSTLYYHHTSDHLKKTRNRNQNPRRCTDPRLARLDGLYTSPFTSLSVC